MSRWFVLKDGVVHTYHPAIYKEFKEYGCRTALVEESVVRAYQAEIAQRAAYEASHGDKHG